MAGNMEVSVGLFVDRESKTPGTMVGLSIKEKQIGLSPTLARSIAIDLMIWADRIEPETNDNEKGDE